MVIPLGENCALFANRFRLSGGFRGTELYLAMQLVEPGGKRFRRFSIGQVDA